MDQTAGLDSGAEVDRLRSALRIAAERLERLAESNYMTEWSRAGDLEPRARLKYAAEAAVEARAALAANR